MYEIFNTVIGQGEDAMIVSGCIALIIILVVVFVDLIKGIFSQFWR